MAIDRRARNGDRNIRTHSGEEVLASTLRRRTIVPDACPRECPMIAKPSIESLGECLRVQLVATALAPAAVPAPAERWYLSFGNFDARRTFDQAVWCSSSTLAAVRRSRDPVRSTPARRGLSTARISPAAARGWSSPTAISFTPEQRFSTSRAAARHFEPECARAGRDSSSLLRPIGTPPASPSRERASTIAGRGGRTGHAG